jgi:hypothetical protein
MSESLIYEFQMTAGFAEAAAERLEQALWYQNERLYHSVVARMPFRPLLAMVGRVLCVVGMALALFGWWVSPRKDKIFVGAFAIFGLLLLTFMNLESIGGAGRRFTRRMIASRARRMMARVAKRAPYSIRYELGDNALATRVEAMGVSLALDLKQVRVAIECQDFVCAFSRPLAQNPVRNLYVPGAREHDALCAALRASGAEVVALLASAEEAFSRADR